MSLSKWMNILWLCCRGSWQDRRHLQTEVGTRTGKHSWEHLKVLVTQSYPTLCDPMDCSPPGSSVHGLLQARILEWVAIPFSRGSFQPKDRAQVSCIAGGFFTIWVIKEAQRTLGPGIKRQHGILLWVTAGFFFLSFFLLLSYTKKKKKNQTT